jgi:hypothetical protein
MIFSLEALNARHGDSLILHFGIPDAPRLMVIDGGPSGVFASSLRPRLDQLRESRTPDGELPVDLLMVSHIDDDHIRGVLDLAEDLAGLTESDQPVPYRFGRLWFNSFDDIVGNQGVEAFRAAAGRTAGPPVDPRRIGPATSVAQGRGVRDLASELALPLNGPFEGLVMAGAPEGPDVDFGDDLHFIVAAPSQERVEDLQREWDAALKAAANQEEAAGRATAYLDQSVPNLSSIVVLAKVDDRSMLLTGDARGDDILTGLDVVGALTDGTLHVDLLKLPHHGSDRNVETDFFRAVTADHYVISADGTHDNPEVATLEMIVEARGTDECEVHFTNSEDRLVAFFDQAAAAGSKVRPSFREADALSLRVDLGDPVPD